MEKSPDTSKTKFNRRIIVGGTGLLGLSALSPLAIGQANSQASAQTAPSNFVKRDGMRFVLNGETYRYVGANMWYAAYLGADAAYGNRPRLLRELDRLKALGLNNLRILASSELSPLNNSLDPAFSAKGKPYNETLLVGLDFLMAEMAKRDMKAVLYLTNFWEWSGGMMAYKYWTTGKLIHAGDPAHPWPAYGDNSALFYKDKKAIKLYHDYTRALVTRTNSFTGKAYRDDETLMAWQLCNEPRPTGGPANYAAMRPHYQAWINETSKLIRSLDQNHLISLGHEGTMGCVQREDCVTEAHDVIDYTTAHIWPQNWAWIDTKDFKGTFKKTEKNTLDYIEAHIKLAKLMNKPLVIEEFGFPRDDGYESGSPTHWRDLFYNLIYSAVEDAMKSGGPMAGSNFWAWGGEGRAQHADYKLKRGETAYIGDPPHEPQGWYSVFDNDVSTKALIKAHALSLDAGKCKVK